MSKLQDGKDGGKTTIFFLSLFLTAAKQDGCRQFISRGTSTVTLRSTRGCPAALFSFTQQVKSRLCRKRKEKTDHLTRFIQ